MTLWRISNHADLAGTGGLLGAARWHSQGRPIVYLATSPASALLEILVHLELDSPRALPKAYQLLQIDVPPQVSRLDLDPSILTDDWGSQTLLTRRIGDRWLRDNASALLHVPSAIVPHTHNVLFNPLHPDARDCRVIASARYPFDPRLFRS